MIFSVALSTYVAGLLTSLTPCVYPMIPLSLGYLGSQQNGLQKRTVIAFSFGQVLMFSLMGLVAVQLGEVFGFLSESKILQFSMGLLLFVFAYYSWLEKLPSFLNKLNSSKSRTNKPRSLFSAFAAGFVSTLVASPCSTPVLGGVLLLISQSENRLAGFGLMFLYGLGLSTLFLILGLGLFKAAQLPKSGQWMTYVHKFSVFLLVGSSFYFFAKGFNVI